MQNKRAQVGLKQEFTVANPAAGVGFNVVPAAGRAYRLIALTFTLTTAVAVANRGVFVTLTNGLDDLGIIFTNFLHVASIVIEYSMCDGFTAIPYTGFGRCLIPCSGNLFLNNGFYVRVAADNIQAADQFSGIRGLAEFWFDD